MFFMKPNHSTAKHYLFIYTTRIEMFENGITKPHQKWKDYCYKIVDEFSKLDEEELIRLESNEEEARFYLVSNNKLLVKMNFSLLT